MYRLDPLVRKACDAGRQINHWLLIICYEPGAWSVKIDNKIYDSRYKQSHDIDWYASALRVEPACIARERASGDCDGKKREENTAGYSVSQGREPFSLVVDHLIERLYKKSRGNGPFVFGRHGLCLLPKGLLKCIRTINSGSQLSQRCAAPDDIKSNLYVLPQ